MQAGSAGSNITIEVVDLASVDSMNAFLSRVRARYASRLRVLINGASTLLPDQPPTTADGLDLEFELNVWSYWALMSRLRVLLMQNGPSSILNVASMAALLAETHRLDSFRLSDLEFGARHWSQWAAYSQSKAAEVIMILSAARHHPNLPVFANAVHPGNVFLADDFGFRSEMLYPQESLQARATYEYVRHRCRVPFQESRCGHLRHDKRALWKCWSGCTSPEDAGRELARLAVDAPAQGLRGRFFAVTESPDGTGSAASDWTEVVEQLTLGEEQLRFDAPELGDQLLTSLETTSIELGLMPPLSM